MKKSVVVAAILVLFAGLSPAEEPPSWVPLLPGVGFGIVTDILEIPGQGVLIACGGTVGPWDYSCVSRSTNQGATWTYVYGQLYGGPFIQLTRDSATGRVWMLRPNNSRPLYYSDDLGVNWTSMDGPNPSNYAPRSMELVGDYLYYGAEVNSPYSICLYRMRQDSLQWEMVTDYTECNAITRLKYHDGKLLVFARDTNGLQTRVFSHTP
jgi:hypothetical protein